LETRENAEGDEDTEGDNDSDDSDDAVVVGDEGAESDIDDLGELLLSLLLLVGDAVNDKAWEGENGCLQH